MKIKCLYKKSLKTPKKAWEVKECDLDKMAWWDLDEAKETRPLFIPSMKDGFKYSGFMSFDFDKVGDPATYYNNVLSGRLANWTHVAYASPSNNGVKIIMPVTGPGDDAKSFKDHFWSVVDSLFNGLAIDDKCCDMTRCLFHPNNLIKSVSGATFSDYSLTKKKQGVSYRNNPVTRHPVTGKSLSYWLDQGFVKGNRHQYVWAYLCSLCNETGQKNEQAMLSASIPFKEEDFDETEIRQIVKSVIAGHKVRIRGGKRAGQQNLTYGKYSFLRKSGLGHTLSYLELGISKSYARRMRKRYEDSLKANTQKGVNTMDERTRTNEESNEIRELKVERQFAIYCKRKEEEKTMPAISSELEKDMEGLARVVKRHAEKRGIDYRKYYPPLSLQSDTVKRRIKIKHGIDLNDKQLIVFMDIWKAMLHV